MSLRIEYELETGQQPITRVSYRDFSNGVCCATGNYVAWLENKLASVKPTVVPDRKCSHDKLYLVRVGSESLTACEYCNELCVR